ncbi:hypothetical protein HDU79_009684 [Rhizoclosmatium sp. JEL0117]|nr:hypothetical protein HDU79_009684 [Rhizoclosmatium sp. JEL0117]
MTKELVGLYQTVACNRDVVVKASDQVAFLRAKIIQSCFDSCGIRETEYKEMGRVLAYDCRDLELLVNLSVQIENAAMKGGKYEGFLPVKDEIGKAVGLLYPELADEVAEDGLPPYV